MQRFIGIQNKFQISYCEKQQSAISDSKAHKKCNTYRLGGYEKRIGLLLLACIVSINIPTEAFVADTSTVSTQEGLSAIDI